MGRGDVGCRRLFEVTCCYSFVRARYKNNYPQGAAPTLPTGLSGLLWLLNLATDASIFKERNWTTKGKRVLNVLLFILGSSSNKVPIQAGTKNTQAQVFLHLFLFLVYCWCDAAIINWLLLATCKTCFILIRTTDLKGWKAQAGIYAFLRAAITCNKGGSGERCSIMWVFTARHKAPFFNSESLCRGGHKGNRKPILTSWFCTS